MTTEKLTAVASARCTPEFLAGIDAAAAEAGMKRGEYIIHVLSNHSAPRPSKKPTKVNILDALRHLGPSTCPEVAADLGCSANQVARRMKDMVIQERVYSYGERPSAETGKLLTRWIAADMEV